MVFIIIKKKNSTIYFIMSSTHNIYIYVYITYSYCTPSAIKQVLNIILNKSTVFAKSGMLQENLVVVTSKIDKVTRILVNQNIYRCLILWLVDMVTHILIPFHSIWPTEGICFLSLLSSLSLREANRDPNSLASNGIASQGLFFLTFFSWD